MGLFLDPMIYSPYLVPQCTGSESRAKLPCTSFSLGDNCRTKTPRLIGDVLKQ